MNVVVPCAHFLEVGRTCSADSMYRMHMKNESECEPWIECYILKTVATWDKGALWSPKSIFLFHACLDGMQKQTGEQGGTGSPGRKASSRTFGTSVGLALCCCDFGVALAGAQARFFPNGGVQRMSAPFDKVSLKLWAGQGDTPPTCICESKWVPWSHGNQVGGAVRGANWAQDTLNTDQLSCLNWVLIKYLARKLSLL